MKSGFIAPVSRRQRDKTHGESFIIKLALHDVNTVVVFALRNDFIGTVVVIINLRIRKRLFVIHFSVVQHLFDGGLAEADGEVVTICRRRQTFSVNTAHQH